MSDKVIESLRKLAHGWQREGQSRIDGCGNDPLRETYPNWRTGHQMLADAEELLAALAPAPAASSGAEAGVLERLQGENAAMRHKLARIGAVKVFLAEQVARRVPQDFLRGVEMLEAELQIPIYDPETGELIRQNSFFAPAGAE